jgi:hypothetical protein
MAVDKYQAAAVRGQKSLRWDRLKRRTLGPDKHPHLRARAAALGMSVSIPHGEHRCWALLRP